MTLEEWKENSLRYQRKSCRRRNAIEELLPLVEKLRKELVNFRNDAFPGTDQADTVNDYLRISGIVARANDSLTCSGDAE